MQKSYFLMEILADYNNSVYLCNLNNGHFLVAETSAPNW